jgi:peptidoglycan/LPS O-acetylase OafA/YrhL
MQNKLREIERLRGVAVLLVIFTHCGFIKASLHEFLRDTWSGVDLFFVISGFVVTRSLVRLLPPLEGVVSFDAAFDAARSALKTFYMRRFFRIAPMALLGMLAARLLIETGHFDGTREQWRREVVAVLAGVYNYSKPIFGYDNLGPYWSLTIEEHFYLLLPVMFLFARTRGRRIGAAVAGIALVVLVLRPVFGEAPHGAADPSFYMHFSSHTRFDSLFAGVAAALAFEQPPGKASMPASWMRWGIIPMCLLLIAMLPGAIGTPLGQRVGFVALWFFSTIAVVFASFDRGYVLSVPGLGRALEHVGARSYAIYILHRPMLRLDGSWIAAHPVWNARMTEGPLGPWLHFALLLGALLAITEVTWRLVEAPLQRFGRRLSKVDDGVATQST